jgi:nucleoside-diphosphate-sugar epimerase
MRARVAVVGASGRVGRTICDHLLGKNFDVVPVMRQPGESADALAARAVEGADVVVNAAGVAHIQRPTPDDLERLQLGNIELPLKLARAAIDRRVPLVHISSIKAADNPPRSPYAQSKCDADERLEREVGPEYAKAGVSLIIVRPLALLFPPLDVGKVRWLRFLRWWPTMLTPPVQLPVLAPGVFLAAVEERVAASVEERATAGLSYRDFCRSERGTLRDVRDAMLPRGDREGSR